MRRPISHAIVASLVALALTGCSDQTTSTAPQLTANRNSVINPPIQIPVHLPPPPPPTYQATDFVQITAGDNHTCARRYNNTVYCWGKNDNGQTGIPSGHTCVSGTLCVDRPTIVFLPSPQGGGNLIATTIDAGANHACVIDTVNDAYCWGDGNLGEVGFAVGSFGPITQPTKVVGGLKYTLISAGSQSTCGSGPSGVFCWGRIQGNAASPVLVSTSTAPVNLSVGDLHACFADATTAVQCWGQNTMGQLGSDRVAHPSSGFSLPSLFFGSPSVATQDAFTCVNNTSGIVQCAGDNTFGQLGNGQFGTSTSTGTPQAVGGGQQFHGVSTGNVHACALDGTNHAYCWGNGFNGQLGNGGSAVYPTPQPVSGNRTYRAIAAGGQHTCAIGTDNHIYCWGQNGFGQLGTQYPGGWVSSPVPALDPP